MLTKRQQQVLRALSNNYGFWSVGLRKWLLMDGAVERVSTSAATLYHLIDAELVAMGLDVASDEHVEATEHGRELVDLLTSTLTKRQQQVLARFRDAEKRDTLCFDARGMWFLPIPGHDDVQTYGEITCSFRTMNILCDAEIVGYFTDDVGMIQAALTPRGRRLAELLP